MSKNNIRILLAIIIAILTGMVCQVNASQITLAWDADANSTSPDGYRIFQRIEGQAYDYSLPVWPKDGDNPLDTECTIMDLGVGLPDPLPATGLSATWDETNSSVTLSWNQSASIAKQKFYWVARSYVGSNESGDSNEVGHEFVVENNTDHWIVYYSETSSGPWVELDVLDNTTNPDKSITVPLTVVGSGQVKTIYFTVVTFGQGDTHSNNASETSVLIDRRVPIPPVNLRKIVVVPVQ